MCSTTIQTIVLSTVAPDTYTVASLRDFKAVVVRDFDTNDYRLVKNPRSIYVGKGGVTVRGCDPKDTVKFGRHADIIDAYYR